MSLAVEVGKNYILEEDVSDSIELFNSRFEYANSRFEFIVELFRLLDYFWYYRVAEGNPLATLKGICLGE